MFLKMSDLSNILMITLNVNGLNILIKRQILVDCIKKHDPTIYCLQETSNITIGNLKEKSLQENIYQVNNQRKAGLAMLISDKVDLRAKKNARDREGQYVMIKS